uniref:CSON009678 protein n=1 Tax=Culicoides sonorensis TaxID=179676 RepID=A0A336MCU3_CULSO
MLQGLRLLPLQLTAEDTAITNFDVTPDSRIELSEAECDIDTLKKLKLGMRSSLWARPANPTPQDNNPGSNGGGGGGGNKLSGHPSDYSIAV